MGGHRQIGGFATYEKVVAPPGGWGPSKGSLALILPTAWVPYAYMAADGHAFRSASGLRALCSTNTDADKMV